MMADIHWFDRLNRLLVQQTPRRVMARGIGALAVGVLLGDAPGLVTAKGKRKRPIRCQKAACKAAFKSAKDIAFCQRKCDRCRRAGTKFCIHEPDEHHPVKHATCCPSGQTCCNHRCVDLNLDFDHCGRCGRSCSLNAVCVDGQCHAPAWCPSGTHLCFDRCKTCCSEQHCEINTGYANMRCLNETCVCGDGTKLCPERGACVFNHECCTNADCPVGQTCIHEGGYAGQCRVVA